MSFLSKVVFFHSKIKKFSCCTCRISDWWHILCAGK
jgi:hypothetical protein